MSELAHKLPKDEHERILRERIIPEYRLDAVKSHENPVAIIIAAAPGTVTGWMSKRVHDELQGDFIRIELDELGDYHPDVNELRRQAPLTWGTQVHEDAVAWGEALTSAVMRGRRNLLLDTSLSDGSWVSADFVEALECSGYSVDIRVISVHQMESELGLDMRMTRSVDREGYTRYIQKPAREESYHRMSDRLDQIHYKSNARIRIIQPPS